MTEVKRETVFIITTATGAELGEAQEPNFWINTLLTEYAAPRGQIIVKREYLQAALREAKGQTEAWITEPSSAPGDGESQIPVYWEPRDIASPCTIAGYPTPLKGQYALVAHDSRKEMNPEEAADLAAIVVTEIELFSRTITPLG